MFSLTGSTGWASARRSMSVVFLFSTRDRKIVSRGIFETRLISMDMSQVSDKVRSLPKRFGTSRYRAEELGLKVEMLAFDMICSAVLTSFHIKISLIKIQVKVNDLPLTFQSIIASECGTTIRALPSSRHHPS